MNEFVVTAKTLNARASVSSKPEDFVEVKNRECELSGIDAMHSIGLALSGGGIRSATFCLGVLQSLAAEGRLRCFDYLSTVSGGGYIGAWLSAWIHRAGLGKVERELGRHGSGTGETPTSAEPEEISWLRRYSNYLTPRVGLFSIDSLTLISIWTRNVVLSFITLSAFFALILMIPRLVLLGTIGWVQQQQIAMGYAAATLGAGLFPAALMANLLHGRRTADESKYWMTSTSGVLLTVMLPGLLAAISGSYWMFAQPDRMQAFTWNLGVWAVVLLVLVGSAGAIFEFYLVFSRKGPGNRAGPEDHWLWRLLKNGVVFGMATAIAIAASIGMLATLRSWFIEPEQVVAGAALQTFGPAVFLIVFGIAGSLFVGLVGRAYEERSREWWSRMNAWFLTFGSAWLAVNAGAFYVPALAEWAFAAAGPFLKGVVGAGWLASLIGTLMAPKKADAGKRGSPYLMTAAKVAAAVLMVGFLIAAATATDALLTRAGGQKPYPVAAPRGATSIDMRVASDKVSTEQHLMVQSEGVADRSIYVAAHLGDLAGLMQKSVHGISFLVLAFLAVALVLAIFSRRVDINKFSLHNMYKNRLIRCYLGASNTRRREQRFTGFDDGDDVRLSDLAGKVVQRPYHLFNCTLNISQGNNLAWQERKGASFVLAPLFCGFGMGKTQGDASESKARRTMAATAAKTAWSLDRSTAYRPTQYYADRQGRESGFTLGMAMATSGAAASPTMGANTSPALAFLMTMLNVRIGRWSPNPARENWRSPSPRIGLLSLLQELFGFSKDTSNFVYLSDGGHFENLGIYELVRRRCRLILVVDAGADGLRTFDDLGRAIRQCRIDFGVDIKLDLSRLRPVDGKTLPEHGCVAGTIVYGDGQEDGTIVLIKPTLCSGAKETVDVLNYGVKHSEFPHQTTVDQFFDESQFESYRQLGIHLGQECMKEFGHQFKVPAILNQQAPQELDLAGRKPHSAGWWWRRLAGGTVALFLALWAIRLWASGVLESINAAYPWLRLPNGDQLFLFADNLFIPVYSAMFIAGLLAVRSRLSPLVTPSVRNRFSPIAVCLVLAGAFADYGENFQLLAKLVGVDENDATISLWTTAKFALFATNSAALAVFYSVSLWRRPLIRHAARRRRMLHGRRGQS